MGTEPHPIYIEDDILANTSHSSYTNPEYSSTSALKEYIYNQIIAEPQYEGCCESSFPLAPTETKTLKPLAPSEISIEENHECPICRLHFGTSLLLENHIKIHTVNNSYTLNEKVDKSSNREAQLHSTSTEKPHVCPHCSKDFKFLSKLNRHIQIHIRKKPYACLHCDKKFSCQYYMRKHMVIHTGEWPHVCPHCGKGFIRVTELRRHILIHTGEKRHVCPHCSKGFTTAGTLNRHKRIHTENRPYVCPHCGTGFTQAGTLRTHVFYTHRRNASCV